MIRIYEKLPDRVEAIQNTEDNDEILQGLSALTPVQEGAYILHGAIENRILTRGDWLVKQPNAMCWFIVPHFQFVNTFQEVPHVANPAPGGADPEG